MHTNQEKPKGIPTGLPELRDRAISEILHHLKEEMRLSPLDHSLELARTHAGERYDYAMKFVLDIKERLPHSDRLEATLAKVLQGVHISEETSNEIAKVIARTMTRGSPAIN